MSAVTGDDFCKMLRYVSSGLSGVPIRRAVYPTERVVMRPIIPCKRYQWLRARLQPEVAAWRYEW